MRKWSLKGRYDDYHDKLVPTKGRVKKMNLYDENKCPFLAVNGYIRSVDATKTMERPDLISRLI